MEIVEPSSQVFPQHRGVEVLVERAEGLRCEANAEVAREDLARDEDRDHPKVDGESAEHEPARIARGPCCIIPKHASRFTVDHQPSARRS